MADETRIDHAHEAETVAHEAETVRSDAADAPTHKLEPRYWAPLRVCPQCSLAWETDADWCASCGTAFDARDREAQTRAIEVTRVRPGRTGERKVARKPRARRSTAAGTTRNTGERAAAHPPAPRHSKPAGSGRALAIAAFLLLIPAAALGYIAGQNSRPSQAEADRQAASAVEQAKRSAVNSYQRNFRQLRAKLEAEAKRRADAAAAQSFAEGKAKAEQEAQQQAGNFSDSIEQCINSLFQDC